MNTKLIMLDGEKKEKKDEGQVLIVMHTKEKIIVQELTNLIIRQEDGTIQR